MKRQQSIGADKLPFFSAKGEHTFWAPPHLPHIEVRTTRNSHQAYAAHWHESFSIGIILEGQTAFSCVDKTYTATAGDLVFLEPGVAHSCNPVGGQPRSYHMLYLDAGWLQTLWQGETAGFVVPLRRLVRSSPFFDTLCAHVDDLCGDILNEKVFSLTVQQVLQRYCHLVPPKTGDSALDCGFATDEILATATSVSIAELAQRNGMRRESFIRSFRKRSGLTPGAYRHCLRLETSRRLLRQGMSITDTALQLGYSDQSHFHRTFVKYFAMTPRQYQQNRSLSFKK